MSARKILFQPDEYAELSAEERSLLAQGYEKAIDAIRRNITPKGFSACSLDDNYVYGTDVNYRSVWARDGALTTIWTLDLEDDDIREAQRNTLHTLLRHQSPTGQIPANVSIDTDKPEYMGIGGIASIDSIMWVIIAAYRLGDQLGDWSIVDRYASQLQRAMDWLGAHDSNNCGLLEIPEASDWADLFGFSYHVLYDEVLWHRTIECYAGIMRHFGDETRASDYQGHADFVRKRFIKEFWPSTKSGNGNGNGNVDEKANSGDDPSTGPTFTDAQYSLGDARYLVAQVSPFSFSWRCDVYGNLLAYLTNLIDKNKAMMTFRFLWGVGVNEPGLVKNLYPPVQAGDPEWRDYYTVNLRNLPNQYHNGGVWPFIGGMWVRYIHKLGMTDLARRELVKLAQMCSLGVTRAWEFNEWHHGITGRAMGKALQAWSAASFIRACHDLHIDADSITHV